MGFKQRKSVGSEYDNFLLSIDTDQKQAWQDYMHEHDDFDNLAEMIRTYVEWCMDHDLPDPRQHSGITVGEEQVSSTDIDEMKAINNELRSKNQQLQKENEALQEQVERLERQSMSMEIESFIDLQEAVDDLIAEMDGTMTKTEIVEQLKQRVPDPDRFTDYEEVEKEDGTVVQRAVHDFSDHVYALLVDRIQKGELANRAHEYGLPEAFKDGDDE